MTTERVIRSYYAIAGTYTLAASIIWGVNTLFLLDAGLDIFEAFVANAAFTVGSVFFEIPTGVLADTRGRRASFLISVAILFLTTLGYVGVAQLGGGIVWFCIVSILVGLGFTFYSGAVDAWLVDALESTGHHGPLDGIFARGSMVTGGAMLIGSVTGGVLGTIDLALPYLMRAVILVVVFAIAWFTMHDLGFSPRTLTVRGIPGEMKKVAKDSLRHGFGVVPLRLLMAIAFVQMGFMMWAWYAWQPYFLELWGSSEAIWLAGVISAVMSLSMVAGNALVERLTRVSGRRTTILACAVAIQVVAAVFVGLAPSFWLAVLAFMVMIATVGVSGPVRAASMHQLIDAEHRASVTSLDAMAGNAGSILGQSGLGYLSRVRSIPESYVLGGIVSVLALPIVFWLRSLDDDSDFIAGEQANEPAGCAPKGAPSVGHLD